MHWGKQDQATMMVAALVAVAMLGPANGLAQNLFVSTSGGYIVEYTPQGSGSVFASGLGSVWGLTFDTAGNLYAADWTNGKIYEFAPDGTRTTFASGLNQPSGLAFDSSGNLYAACYGSGVIEEFASDGTMIRSLTANPRVDDLAFDSNGNLYAGIDFTGGGHAILKFGVDGTRSNFGASGTYTGLAFDSAGHLYASDLGASYIWRYDADGTRINFSGYQSSPGGLAFDTAGNLYAESGYLYRIYEYTPDGTSTIFVASTSPYGQPNDLAFGPSIAPEPSTWALLGLGAAALALYRRRA
jgi:sugar lactone lactonase YvrE